MKELKTIKLNKKIIFIIILIMLCNFIMPNYIYAVSTDEGSTFIGGIAELFCIVPDALMYFLQRVFISGESLQAENGEYQIMYSPGVIFSGGIPAFDINFLDPDPSKTGTITTTKYYSLITALEEFGAENPRERERTNSEFENLKNEFGYNEDGKIDINNLEGNLKVEETQKPYADDNIEATTKEELKCVWYNSDRTLLYAIVDYQYTEKNTELNFESLKNENYILYELPSEEALKNAVGIAGTTAKVVKDIEYKSSAGVLQKVISTWYNVLRRIALVGLLSVLVYIGIRIVLTSTSAKDKAKYKKMLLDWLTAICMLYALHYIMNITVTFVDKISEVLKVSTIGVSGQDTLMSSVRNNIAAASDVGTALVYIIIYDILFGYTCIYTVQYITRVIHLGFLTVIAPLITLTYPIDKIKDSKSQAFDMWLKDYIFFSLLQVVHLLIYYIFLGSAVDLANKQNWLFAVVAIAFLPIAEKYVKKMFGFEKSKSMSAIAAGATGALVTDFVNSASKLGSSKGSKGGNGGSEGTEKPVRTATTNPLAGLDINSLMAGNSETDDSENKNLGETGADKKTKGKKPTPGDSSARKLKNENKKKSPSPGAKNSEPSNAGAKPSTPGTKDSGSSSPGSKTSNSGEKYSKPNKKKTTSKDSDKLAKKGKRRKKARTIGKKATTLVGKGVLSLGAGTIKTIVKGNLMFLTLGAGIPEAKLEKIVTAALGGKTAGDRIIKNTISGFKGTVKGAKGVLKTVQDGTTRDKEKLQNTRFDREFKKSNAYKKLKKENKMPEEDFEKAVQEMLNAGITDTEKMSKILKRHKKDPKKYSIGNSIALSTLSDMCPEEILFSDRKFIRFCQDRNIIVDEEILKEMRNNMQYFK